MPIVIVLCVNEFLLCVIMEHNLVGHDIQYFIYADQSPVAYTNEMLG